MKYLLIISALLFTACGDCKDMSDAMCTAYKAGNGVIKTSNESTQRTPNGSWVFGKQAVSANQLALIDAGLTDAFNDARLSGYSHAVSTEFYQIFTVIDNCVLSPEQQIPSFYLRADSYDGTEFDQYNPNGKLQGDGVGVILAAEMVMSLSGIGQMYVCKEPNILKEAVRNGAEHIIIFNNDPDYYNATWWHGSGIYHPLLPKRQLRLKTDGKPNPNKFIVRAVK